LFDPAIGERSLVLRIPRCQATEGPAACDYFGWRWTVAWKSLNVRLRSLGALALFARAGTVEVAVAAARRRQDFKHRALA